MKTNFILHTGQPIVIKRFNQSISIPCCGNETSTTNSKPPSWIQGFFFRIGLQILKNVKIRSQSIKCEPINRTEASQISLELHELGFAFSCSETGSGGLFTFWRFEFVWVKLIRKRWFPKGESPILDS